MERPTALDICSFGTNSRDPFLHGLGDELRSIVEPDVTGNTPEDEEVGQNVDHIDGLKLAGDADRQAFVGFAGPLAGLPQLVHKAFCIGQGC